MQLPLRPRRAHLQAFGVIVALGAGLLAGIVAERIEAGLFWPTLTAGAILAGCAYARPTLMSSVYRVLLSLTGHYMRASRWMIKAICFFILFVIVGRGGSILPLRLDAGSSMWSERRSLLREEFRHEYEGAARHVPAGHWCSTYIRWAKASGNVWVVALLPFLILLAFFDEQEEADFPQNIYTLF